MRALRTIVLLAGVTFAPAVRAHAGLGVSEWGAEPWLAMALAIAGGLYLRGVLVLTRSGSPRPAIARHAALFLLGWLALAAAFASPLADATEGLFSAHMIQHELLMVIGAPLMVLGRPLAIWTWALPAAWRRKAAAPFQGARARRAWRTISGPAAATALHAAAIWVWHIPAVFESAQSGAGLHALQHSAFLFSALLFWWAMLRPGRDSGAGAAVLCLFLTMLHTSALGVLLTFSRAVWYPASTVGAAAWGLTPLEDQQLGGLVMWVPGSIPYVVAALVIAARALMRDPGRMAGELSTP